jgi:hypothetical protein
MTTVSTTTMTSNGGKPDLTPYLAIGAAIALGGGLVGVGLLRRKRR